MADEVNFSIGQIRDAWDVMCATSPGLSRETGQGIEYIFSGLPIGFFNVALPMARGISSDALTALGRDACAWAVGKSVPWLFIVTHNALERGVDAASVLDGCGLAPMMPLTGMIARQVDPVSQIPDGLQLTVPQDDAGCSVLLDINSVAYGMELNEAKDVIGKRSFWRDHVPVLGLIDGAPASCAAVLMVAGYRYVALVATDPAQQRRGYAETVMRHALDVAALEHGDRPTVLHATDAGRPIYQRMGYRDIASHTIFMEKKFLGEH
jgi:GNAT superfamily N-acetyltransferase